MSRAPALRKLLAVEPLYRDEILSIMGGDRVQVGAAIQELARNGDLEPVRHGDIRARYHLTPQAQAFAFGGAHA